MSNHVIAEGRTTNEAIENGLKQLNTTRNNVEIKVLENEEKRSFFSILAPRVIKVELTLKENREKIERKEKNIVISKEELEEISKRIEVFLEDFLKSIQAEKSSYQIIKEEGFIRVLLEGDDVHYLIGYRGEVLNSLQVILNNIASKKIEKKCRIILDIEGYRGRREKTLEELADKVSRTVIKNRKSITLEPMTAYERKIIHSRLQASTKVTTHSIGEEPNRRIVIEIK